MKLSLAGKSMLLFGVSVALWIAITIFDSALAGMPPGAQRPFAFLLLVLPPASGSVLGVMSLLRKEGQAWLAVISVALNTLFALFHLMVTVLAG